MKILLTGVGGILGSGFAATLRDHAVTILGREALNVADPQGVVARVVTAQPDVLINCAADTDVEGAERDPSSSHDANAVLPDLLAAGCARVGALMTHFSSTGCYGAAKTTPYTEDDAPQPTTVYHRDKLAGEAAVAAAGGRYLILRTGWLFGGTPQHKKNFVWRRLLEARGQARMVSDGTQFGNPTFAGDLMRQTMALIAAGTEGVYNAVNSGEASRYDYVAALVAAAGLPCVVERSEAGFPRLAKVSPNEMARNARLDALQLNIMPPWREALRAYVASLLETEAWRSLEPESKAAQA